LHAARIPIPRAKRITALHYALHVLPRRRRLRDTVVHGAATTWG
jgi:hypothetical protein